MRQTLKTLLVRFLYICDFITPIFIDFFFFYYPFDAAICIDSSHVSISLVPSITRQFYMFVFFAQCTSWKKWEWARTRRFFCIKENRSKNIENSKREYMKCKKNFWIYKYSLFCLRLIKLHSSMLFIIALLIAILLPLLSVISS